MDLFEILGPPMVSWKNGGGHTRTLMQETDADARMLWRLSLADIDRDGPFSTFAGVHRYHVIVRGAGLTLTAQDRTIKARPFCMVEFDGDTAFDAILADGPCQAVNLMVDPRRVSVEVPRLEHGVWASEASQILVVCMTGTASLDVPKGHLEPGQGVRLSGPAQVQAGPGAKLVCFGLTYGP